MENNLRYEIKMVFDALRLDEARSWVYTHPDIFRIAYPPRQINNIYFDTPERNLLMDHLEGVANRVKIRYRWYGKTWHAKNGQIEIKVKRGNLGYKDTIPIPGDLDISNLSWREIHSDLTKSVEPLILAVLKKVEPTIINFYQREYFISIDGAVRVTLDYNMQVFDQTFGISPNINFKQPLKSSMVIELKSQKHNYMRLSDSLSKFPLYCTQNSKYLNGMENAI